MLPEPADTEFHYANEALTQLEQQALHFCHYGRALTLVIGVPGSGRSHFARRLKRALEGSLALAFIEAHPLISSEQIETSALEQFGLTQLALQHRPFASALREAPKARRVLLIDDAQDLALHVLRALLDAADARVESPALVLVLFGDEMLETALAELDYAGLPEADIQRLHLPSLSPDDSQQLAAAYAMAHAEALLPAPDWIRVLWQKSAGRPGIFLQLLKARGNNMSEFQNQDQDDEALVADAMEHHSTAQPSLMTQYGWLKLPAIFLGVFLLALVLLYQKEFNAWLSDAPTEPAENSRARTELAVSPETVPEAAAEASSPAPENLTIVEEYPAATETPIQSPEPALQAPAPAPIAIESERSSAVLEPPLTASTTQSLSADEQRLMKAPASAYAVQIIGLSEEAAMTSFMRQHKLSEGLRYRSLRNGQPWQILVLGPFDTRAQAEKMRDKLPESVRKQGPWLKSLKVIQQEIQSAAKQRG